MKKGILTIILALVLAGTMTVGCAVQPAGAPASAPAAETAAEEAAEAAETAAEEAAEAVEAAAEEAAETAEPAEKTAVRFGVLKGPTGIGASYLLEQDALGETANDYDVTVAAEATEMVTAMAAGQLDIAAVPTNAAAALYKKTGGSIRIAALNTAGVLYILESGDSIQSMADLAGRTIHAVGQGANPEYVLNYLLTENGLVPGEDVTIEFHDSAELATLAATGGVDLCMLPVPAATQVLVKNQDFRAALDLSEEWDRLDNGSVLTMGCVVVQAAFAEEHPEAVDDFLAEYETSINYVRENPAEAGALCEKYEIVGAAPVAAKAIPDCNLIFVSGEDIRPAIEGYYEVLFAADPTSIGGSLPDDAFYQLR